MEGSRSEIAVGAIVLIIAVGFLVWLLQFTNLTHRGGYEVTASFRSAEGLAVGTEVRLAGIRIGQVARMTLDPVRFRAETALRLDDGVVIPADSTAAVSSDGLMGGAFVEIYPGGAPDDLPPGGEITDTQGAVSLLHLLMKYVSGEDDAG